MAKLETARWLGLGAALLLAAGACSHWPRVMPGQSSPGHLPPTVRPDPMQPAAIAPRNDLSDAKVVAVLLAANNTDISYARLAPSRAQSAAVKSFAEQMLADHTNVNQLVENLLTKIDLEPVDDKMSLDFRDESANKRDMLRELEGRAFDSTYMKNEVEYHARFVRAIDVVLLPSARNPQLRALITNVRPAVVAHLGHALQLQGAIAAAK